jgi:hypothetical protein
MSVASLKVSTSRGFFAALAAPRSQMPDTPLIKHKPPGQRL